MRTILKLTASDRTYHDAGIEVDEFRESLHAGDVRTSKMFGRIKDTMRIVRIKGTIHQRHHFTFIRSLMVEVVYTPMSALQRVFRAGLYFEYSLLLGLPSLPDDVDD
jgi:hypothetical protein